MSVHFTADEIFDIAERLEKRAILFYTEVAESCPHPSSRKLLRKLAAMEVDHEKIFSGLRQSLRTRTGAKALSRREAAQWTIIAEMMLNNLDRDIAARFRNKSDWQELMREAIGFEKDTITFFLGLKSMVVDPRDKKKIDAIIMEETGHVLALSSELASNRKPGN